MFGLIFGLVAMPVLLLETAMVRSQSFAAGAIANVLVYPAILLVSIAVHETGHALVGRAVGLHILRIEIGLGRRIARWRIGSLRFQLNMIPMLGLTRWGMESRSVRRWQLWLGTLAGPLMTLVIVVVALRVAALDIRDVLWPSAAVAGGLAVGTLIAFQNLWMLIRNLLPLNVLGYRTDGSSLLRIPFAPQRELEMLRLMPTMLEVEEHMERKAFDAAQRALDRASEIDPESVLVRCDRATLEILRGRFAEARDQLVALVADPAVVLGVRWVVLNNLAWADYMLGEPELRDEADRHSQEMFRKWKHSPHAMETRGAVLGWLGRHDEAIDLLDRAWARHSSPTSRATTACCLAISWTAFHDELAERWLSRARQADSTCPLLERAATAVEQARAPVREVPGGALAPR